MTHQEAKRIIEQLVKSYLQNVLTDINRLQKNRNAVEEAWNLLTSERTDEPESATTE